MAKEELEPRLVDGLRAYVAELVARGVQARTVAPPPCRARPLDETASALTFDVYPTWLGANLGPVHFELKIG